LIVIPLAALIGAVGPSASAARPLDEFRVYKPVADTYVTAARARVNFGRSPELRVDAAPETAAFLRFRLRPTGAPIASVTLLLHPRSPARSFAVRRVADNEWRERRLTYTTAPIPSLRYAASRPVRQGDWSAVDVTSFIDPNGGEEISLAITTRGRRAISFGSRESRFGPRLVVRTGEGAALSDRILEALLRN
jgi:hypothetical protein